MRLPRLSRKQKTVRNLLVMALCVFLTAWAMGFPSWTEAGILRRAERQYLLEGSEPLFTGEDRWGRTNLYARNGDLLLRAAYHRTGLFWLSPEGRWLYQEPDAVVCEKLGWERDETSDEGYFTTMAFGSLERYTEAELEVVVEAMIASGEWQRETYTARGVQVSLCHSPDAIMASTTTSSSASVYRSREPKAMVVK